MSADETKSLVKHSLLRAAKLGGLFRLARHLTRKRLRILCYHGISLDDEHAFRPMLFMKPGTFEARVGWLKRNGYPVLPLGTAIDRMGEGTLPDFATVLTIDDGWKGTARYALPVLEGHKLPATLYHTTYYATRQLPVFDVCLGYLLWKTQVGHVDLSRITPRLSGRVDLRSPGGYAEAFSALDGLAETLSTDEKQALLGQVGTELGIDTDALTGRGCFMLMDERDCRAWLGAGLDIQLHTHRHRFPIDNEGALVRELDDNAAALRARGATGLRHLCYPSGVYDASTWSILADRGIDTAVTTRRGLADAESPPHELPRILDSEEMSWIEFESEMCGFQELVRLLRGSGTPPAH